MPPFVVRGPVTGLVFLLALLAPSPAASQTHSMVHVSLGAGATGLDAGIDLMHGRIGVGAVAGAGAVFLGSVYGSYGLLPGDARSDLRLTAGFTTLSSSEVSSKGLSAGLNATVWPTRRIGFHVAASRYLRLHETRSAMPPGYRYNIPYWSASGGVAVRLH